MATTSDLSAILEVKNITVMKTKIGLKRLSKKGYKIEVVVKDDFTERCLFLYEIIDFFSYIKDDDDHCKQAQRVSTKLNKELLNDVPIDLFDHRFNPFCS